MKQFSVLTKLCHKFSIFRILDPFLKRRRLNFEASFKVERLFAHDKTTESNQMNFVPSNLLSYFTKISSSIKDK